MFELIINGRIEGVFSTEQKTKEFAEKHYDMSSYQVFPLGTFLHTDIEEEEPPAEVETKTTSLFCDECGKEEKVEMPCNQSVSCNLMLCKECKAEGKEEECNGCVHQYENCAYWDFEQQECMR